MKKEQLETSGRPQSNTVVWIMVGILLVLAGLVGFTLMRQVTKPSHDIGSSILLDASQTHSSADLASFYNSMENGDSRLAITNDVGWPGDCLKEVTTSEGKLQVCMWFNDQTSVVVTMLNDQVVHKTKVGF